MTQYHLAQINIGRILAPTDDPIMAEFMNNLDRINALAEQSPGFVWRFQTAEGNATAVRPYEDDRMLINFSVWTSVDALKEYVYKSAHVEFLRQRRLWFEKMTDVYMALWWVRAGHIPTWQEAIDRLGHLQAHGETPHAFSFRHTFPPDGDRPQFIAPPNWNPCPAV